MATKKEVAEKAAPAPYRKFKVFFEIEGRMVDKDTKIGKESLEDFFSLLCPKGLKIERLRVQEIQDVGKE